MRTPCARWLRSSAGGIVIASLVTCLFGVAKAATPPSQITIGTLYASSGTFAVASQAEFQGLKYWANGVNKTGGVFVKAFDKKIPVKIVAYDDQSSTSTATTLYNQLITQNHVDVLVADFGSVLTSVAIPLAAEHHMLLIDPTGSGSNFFKHKTDYLADVSIPSSSIWPIPLGKFLVAKNIKRVAILYDSNDFDASQANTLKSVLTKSGISPVYFHGVPTDESNYSILLHSIAAQHPDALLEFGYNPNDIAFLRDLSGSGLHFNMVFTVFPGQLLGLIEKNVGTAALDYTYTYPTPPLVKYNKVDLGENTATFVKDFERAEHAKPNFLDAAGYNTGLIIQAMLGKAGQFNQLAFHQALMNISGTTTTLLGQFKINTDGAQLGELLPVAQLQPSGKGIKIAVVYPPNKANGKAIYPAPQQ